MCGRFALSVAPQVLVESFNVQPLPGLKPRYNIAPTQLIAAAQPISPRSVPFITEETLRTAQKFLEWLEEENEVPEDDDEK